MKKVNVIGFIAAALLGGAVSSFLVFSVMQRNYVKTADLFNPNLQTVSSQDGPSGAPSNFTYAAEQTVNGVVHVKTYASEQAVSDPILEFFFGQQRGQGQGGQQVRRGAGSGVIVTKDGYIVTNNHVIEGAEKIEVTLNDKRTFPAKLVGTDPNTDIALLRIDAKDLPFVKIGDSDNLQIGEWVIAVGNPFNLTSTVTAGIVSAKGRNFPISRDGDQFKVESFIQTDAVVNPGNSGGALVNTKGELVGINTAIYTQNGVFNGYSFAVPSSIVKKVVYDLMEFGAIQRAYLGIEMGEITSDNFEQLGLKKIINGVYINKVNTGSAAEDAGIKEKDILTSINGANVNSLGQVQEQVSRYRPGDVIDVAIIRNENLKHFKVTLRKTSGGDEQEVASNGSFTALGATFVNVNPQLKSSLRLKGGVQVKDLSNGKLKSHGIQKGLIILRINKQPINSVENLAEVLATAQQRQVLIIEGVYPNGIQAMYSIGI